MDENAFIEALANGKLDNETDEEFFSRMKSMTDALELIEKEKKESIENPKEEIKYVLALDKINPDELVTDFEVEDVQLTKDRIKEYATAHAQAIEEEIHKKKQMIQMATVLVGLGVATASTGGLSLPALVGAAVKIGQSIMNVGPNVEIPET